MAPELTLARDLARQAGLSAACMVERLSGGKNNRVFAVAHADGTTSILKIYHRSADDPRDRLGAEWRFLSYARARGIDAAPTPLAMNASAGAALTSHLPGSKLRAGDIKAAHVRAARDFIVALNAGERDLQDLAPGSEACFSIADHLAMVQRRIARLARLDPAAPHRNEAERFIADRLVPAWEAVSRQIRASDLPLHEPLTAVQRILSPSDFGFHNALDDKGCVGFLDFEYAGLDDPAKLVGDFFSVPEIPTPPSELDDFVEGLAQALPLDPDFRERARRLLPAYRIKWACIILNDFLPDGAVRRDFALGASRADRCRAQLGKAARQLGQNAVAGSEP